MKTEASILQPAPPLVLGAGLLLWGWQNHFLVYAIVLALILESAHLVNWRWSTSDKEFNNIADLSGVGFFIVVVYIFFTVRSQGIYTILAILPFVFFLIVMTQLYSEQGSLKLSVLLVSLRRLEPDRDREINKNIDITLPYFMLCLISASAGNQRTLWFYVLVCLLLGYVLWYMRPGRYHMVTWLTVLTLAVGAGFGGQIGLQHLQRSIEISLMSVFDQFMWRYRDPNRVTTAIGSIGRLKFSDRILVRVKTKKKLTRPLYLHEAAYDSYNYGVWSATKPEFTVIDPDPGGDSWTLNSLTPANQARISAYMIKQTGVVPLPSGTSSISGPGIIEINRNGDGTVKMEMRAGWISYTAGYADGELPHWQPQASDLSVPKAYKSDFEKLANALSLYGKPQEQIVQTVKKFFAENFQYSLNRRVIYPRRNFLYDFLFVHREGHCEYFATTTVLLLRTLGIPARYAVGYYIDEYSNLEGQYIGRSRDAHAWVLADINNKWQILDTTPSTWVPYENARASDLEPLFDFAAWLRYKFSRWQSKDELEDEKSGQFQLLWLLIPLTLILAWRLYVKERIRTFRKEASANLEMALPGMDSDFYRLVNAIEGQGFQRATGETLLAWLDRLESRYPDIRIKQALKLHYQYRFDPRGLAGSARQQLAKLVNEILADLKTATV